MVFEFERNFDNPEVSVNNEPDLRFGERVMEILSNKISGVVYPWVSVVFLLPERKLGLSWGIKRGPALSLVVVATCSRK